MAVRHPGESACSGHAGLLAGADRLPDQFQYFIIFRKSIGIEFGEDDVIVDEELEAPAVAWFQGDFGEVLVVLVNDEFHRTGGVLGVASRSAIFKHQLVVHMNLP